MLFQVPPFVDISIHALRKESDLRFRGDDFIREISIHALRKESDMLNIDMMVISSLISIHALRKESDTVI